MPSGHTTPRQAIACARFLPAPLIEARAAVFDPLNCLDLDKAARHVLYGTLAFLNLKNLKKGIWPGRELLRAESLLGSDSTLYRGLALLEKCGYITREQIRRRFTGKFHVSPILLTEKALVLLGLRRVIHKQPSAKVTDGQYKKEHTKEQSVFQNTTGKAEIESQNGIDRSTKLPTPLVPLLRLGVKKSAVCWLMAEAKRRGKRLEEVFHGVQHRIQVLQGREVVAYLKTMLAKEIDFAWLASQRVVEAERSSRESEAQAKLESLDVRYEGFEVLTANGESLGRFKAAEGPSSTPSIVSASGSLPVNLRFVKAWMDGRISFRRPAP